MAIDIFQLPGMGGQTGQIVGDGIQLVENAVLCVATESLENCFQSILVAFQLVWDAFQALFPSRPKVGKDSASDDTALYFISAANPVISLWGAGIRNLESQGIPTSASGGAGYKANLDLADAVLADLQRQFDGPNAGKITLGGLPVTGANLFALYHQLGFNTNHPDSNAQAIQQRIRLDNLYDQLVIQGGIDPNTGFPPPPKPPPTCPPGQHWDGTKCVPDTVKTVLPPGDPDQDEFQDCCDETLAALAGLQSAIGGAGGGTSPDCCATLAAALSGLGVQLTGMASALLNLGGIQTDMGGVIAGLNRIGDGLAKLDLATPQPFHVVIDNPPAPDNITVNVTPPDLSAITKALQDANLIGDVPPQIIQQLISDGYIEQEYSGMLQGSPWSHVMSVINSLTHSRLYQKMMAAEMAAAKGDPLLGSTYNANVVGKGKSITDIKNLTTSDFVNFTTDTIAAVFEKVFGASKTVFSPIVNGILTAHNGEIAKLRNVAPCQEKTVATNLLTEAIGAGIAAHIASAAVEATSPIHELGIGHVGEIIAAIAGVEDIIKGIIGVEINQLVAIPHRYCINEQGRTILPGAGEAASLHARGLITAQQADQLLAFNGLNAGYVAPTLAGAYEGISVRQLVRLFSTGLFTAADIQDELNFAGVRPVSQHRYQLAAPYIATNPERTQLRNQLEAEYEAGLLSLNDLIGQIDSADHLLDRDKLIVNRVNSKVAVEIAAALEKEYTTMYIASLIDHATYTGNLAGMGLQQWRVNTLVGIADARKAATLARQMAAEERALVRATAAQERKAAMEGFATGTLNAAALTAALVATGLTAAQTGAWVALAELKKEGALRWVYGLQLQPAQATLLKERVGALTTQREKGYITPVEYVNALNALKIPAHWVNGLLAKAEATIAASKGGALVHVQTQ